MTLLRPASATWFELLTAREQLEAALRSLAATREVELQSHSDVTAVHLLPKLRAALDDYRRLAQSYAQYWPPAGERAVERERELADIPEAALKQLRAWAHEADPLIARLQQRSRERSELELLQPLLARPHAALPNLELFTQAGPILASRAYALPAGAGSLGIPSAVLAERIDIEGRSYLLALGPAQTMDALDETLSASKAQRFDLPRALPVDRAAAAAQVAARIAAIAAESRELEASLAELSREHGLSAVLADLAFVEWLVRHVPELAVTEHFGWITGWTTDPSGARLQAALQRAHVNSVLRFPHAPPELARPVVLHNPRWAQPFELFARLLGIPAASETDPSVILALLVPLLFGFMFGDVGQATLLIIAGVALRRRYPALALLIPCGIAAVLFGLLFGSVFTLDGLIPALWLRPLEQPLTVLRVSVAFGAGILLIGMLLDGMQHYWAGEARRWWSARAGLVLAYLAVIAAGVSDLRTLFGLPVGLAWYAIGESAHGPAPLRQLAASLGESLEVLSQLLVNTLSFVRVGAFALAHAGLAAAINGLAAGAGSRPGAAGVLAVGNLVVMIIEGFVVAIQTTRLVLFEFFIRFLRGSGRPFRPLPALAAPTALRTTPADTPQSPRKSP